MSRRPIVWGAHQHPPNPIVVSISYPVLTTFQSSNPNCCHWINGSRTGEPPMLKPAVIYDGRTTRVTVHTDKS